MGYFNFYDMAKSVLDLPVGFEFVNVIFALFLGIGFFVVFITPLLVLFKIIFRGLKGGR